MKITKFYRYLIFLTIAALLLRLGVVMELLKNSNAVLNPAESTDPATYIRLARDIVNGNFSGPFYYQPFYYAGFLAPIVWVFGDSLIPAIICQAILGSLTVFLVGLIGKYVYSERVGIVSALFGVIANILIFYTPYHKIATLQGFNVTLFSLFLILAIKESAAKKSLIYYCIAGLVMGIACATRGNIYLMLFGILPLVFVKGCLERKKLFSLGAIALLFVSIFIAQSPFIIYNTIKCGKLTGASTASAAVLALGNTPEAPAGGRDYFSGNGPMEYPESYEYFMARDSERAVPLQIMDYFFDKPLEYIELSFRKVLLFWSWGEIPNNVSYYEGLKNSSILRYNILGQSFFIMFLGIAGILLTLKGMFKERNYPLIMLFLSIIFYHLSIAFFYNLGRFRMPILPDMAVFAGIFVVKAVADFKNREKIKWLVLSLLGGIYVVFFAYWGYQKYYESMVMTFVRPNGTIINTLNDKEKCIFDYGPMSLGDWMNFTFDKKSLVSKEFKVKDLSQSGKLKFMLSSQGNQGIAVIKINGVIHKFNLAESDNGYFTVPTQLVNGKVNLQLIDFYGNKLSKEVELSLDNQRFYSRSEYNGEVVPFEWIMRFYYIEKE